MMQGIHEVINEDWYRLLTSFFHEGISSITTEQESQHQV